MTLLHEFDVDFIALSKAIHKFNTIKPQIKNDFFECDVFFSRIMTPDISLMSYPIHQHSFYELHIPILGKAEYLIEGETICCIPQKALLFAPNSAHRLAGTERYVSVTLGFAFVSPIALAAQPVINKAYTEIACSPDIYNSIFYILHTLLDETIEDHYIFNSLFSVIIHDILMRIPLFREEFKNSSTSLTPERFSDDARIRVAMQYISDNIAFPISANDVSNHVLLSSRQLNRILKNAMNLSINRLINEIRIKTATWYMATSDFSLSKIAMLCGFNSPTHFNLTFKKITGITPKLFRQTAQVKKQENRARTEKSHIFGEL